MHMLHESPGPEKRLETHCYQRLGPTHCALFTPSTLSIMPRDLFPERPTEEAHFSKGPESDTSERSAESKDNGGFIIYPHSDNSPRRTEAIKKIERRENLHPYVSTLSLADVESCVRLEEASFPEPERCSREKVCPTKDLKLLEESSFCPLSR